MFLHILGPKLRRNLKLGKNLLSRVLDSSLVLFTPGDKLSSIVFHFVRSKHVASLLYMFFLTIFSDISADLLDW